jgi:hypothetical protein
MKLSVKLLLACLFVASFAQAAVTQVTEFDDLMRQYGNDVQLSAGAIYEAGVSELQQKYASAVERSLQAAQNAGKLEDALAFKQEAKLIADGGDPAAEDASLPPEVQKLRAIYRQSLARLEQEKSAATNPIINALIGSLDRLIVTLTKAGRLDEAVFVKQKKDKLGEEIAKATAKIATTGSATRKGAFTNTLGMKFVPVPGTKVLFCIHETRRRDYAAYARAVPDVKDTWKKPQFNGIPVSPKDDYPVAAVSLDDANAFCAWLSKKEGKIYRVPTDREWSCAVGLGKQEKDSKDVMPNQLNGKVEGVYPWDGDYPPKAADHDGNYADTTLHEALPPTHKQAWIEGYTDGFATTAPVMSFKPNQFGIYDMGGNLNEWCSDLYDENSKYHVLRGGAWNDKEAGMLLSAKRSYSTPAARETFRGFRVILEQP